MKNRNTGLILVVVIIAIVAVLGVSTVGSYNSLVGMQEEVSAQQSTIQTQLQRRNDLIPNLVETVKGYAAHEEEIFTELADARAALSGAGTVDEMSAAEEQMQSALSRLLVVVENYPDLKSDQQYTALMDELAGTENRIQVARKDYNDVAKTYNQKLKQFPTVITARILGFDSVDYFEASDQAQQAPVVDFGNDSAS